MGKKLWVLTLLILGGEGMSNKVILVGVFPQGGEKECLKSLDELERLADTAGAETYCR